MGRRIDPGKYKDIPNKDFFNVQVGVGGNTATMGQEFKIQKGGKWDFRD
jgi:hypothetical protein